MPASVEKTNFLPDSYNNLPKPASQQNMDEKSEDIDMSTPDKPLKHSDDKTMNEMSGDFEAHMPYQPVDSADNSAIPAILAEIKADVHSSPVIHTKDPDKTRELSRQYRVTTKQGDGGCSVVYDAWRISDGAHVVLKVLALPPTLDPQEAERTRERFFTEAQILTSFVDDHIVKCLDYGLFGGAPCVVLEYISGKQLDDYIRDYGMLPYEYAIGIMHQVLLALDEAHTKGIIHRDLKPANILIINETDPPFVKLIDFGIATITERAHSSLSKTPTGVIRGTPSYMAPELFSGEISATVESDLYAIGLILLECLTGSVAFAAPSLMQVAYKQVNENLEIPDFIPNCLKHIIKQCCEKDPGNRYHAARDLIHDLDNALPMALAEKDKCEKNYLKSVETASPNVKRKQSNIPVIIAAVAVILAAVAIVIVVLNMPNGTQQPLPAVPQQETTQAPTPNAPAAPSQAVVPADSEPAAPAPTQAAAPEVPAPAQPTQAAAPEAPVPAAPTQAAAPEAPVPPEPTQAVPEPQAPEQVAPSESDPKVEEKPVAAQKTKSNSKPKTTASKPKSTKSENTGSSNTQKSNGKKTESTYLPTDLF